MLAQPSRGLSTWFNFYSLWPMWKKPKNDFMLFHSLTPTVAIWVQRWVATLGGACNPLYCLATCALLLRQEWFHGEGTWNNQLPLTTTKSLHRYVLRVQQQHKLEVFALLTDLHSLPRSTFTSGMFHEQFALFSSTPVLYSRLSLTIITRIFIRKLCIFCVSR